MTEEKNSSPLKNVLLGNFNVALVLILIIASFVIGSLYTKVRYLEGGAGVAGTTTTGKNQAAGAPAAAGAPQPQVAAKKPEVTNADWYRGNKNAKVVMVEYSDLECPFCKSFHPTMQQVMKDYGDKVKWVYRHYPLSFHANAQKEAEATECAGKLGGNEAFWKYTDAIFERTTSNGTGFALDKLVPLAKELGLNESSFKQCLDSGEMAQKVKDQMAKGTAEGVTGTPGTIIINAKGDTQLVPGALPFEQVKPMIDKALQS
jgi:protein-disulfide isomerase